MLGAMADEAAKLLSAGAAGGGARTFAVSTNIAKEWLAREEGVWDRGMAGCESIKSMLNRTLIAKLRRATGMEQDVDGDLRATFDFEAGTVSVRPNELFIFGRYKKLAPGLSQSRWLCAKCSGKGCGACNGKGKNYESVEERVGEPFKAATGAESYVLHASGREDVDATNSAGRPFVLELKAAKVRNPGLEAVAAEVRKGGEVEVSSLRAVPRAFAEVVTESHFDKAYEAEVEFGREVSGDDMAAVRALEGKTILQQTPERVAHRRADLVRHRKIKHIEMAVPQPGNAKRATIVIKAEAGTYIKELISGDGGRTRPSVAEVLGTAAKCTRLEVVAIDDGYLDFCLGKS